MTRRRELRVLRGRGSTAGALGAPRGSAGGPGGCRRLATTDRVAQRRRAALRSAGRAGRRGVAQGLRRRGLAGLGPTRRGRAPRGGGGRPSPHGIGPFGVGSDGGGPARRCAPGQQRWPQLRPARAALRRGRGEARRRAGATTTIAASVARLAAPPVLPAPHVVVRGETLSSIADDELGTPAAWPFLWETNRGRSFGTRVFEDPNLILPGWDLAVPGPAAVEPAVPEPIAAEAVAPVLIPPVVISTPVEPASPTTSIPDPTTSVHDRDDRDGGDDRARRGSRRRHRRRRAGRFVHAGLAPVHRVHRGRAPRHRRGGSAAVVTAAGAAPHDPCRHRGRPGR